MKTACGITVHQTWRTSVRWHHAPELSYQCKVRRAPELTYHCKVRRANQHDDDAKEDVNSPRRGLVEDESTDEGDEDN